VNRQVFETRRPISGTSRFANIILSQRVIESRRLRCDIFISSSVNGELETISGILGPRALYPPFRARESSRAIQEGNWIMKKMMTVFGMALTALSANLAFAHDTTLAYHCSEPFKADAGVHVNLHEDIRTGTAHAYVYEQSRRGPIKKSAAIDIKFEQPAGSSIVSYEGQDFQLKVYTDRAYAGGYEARLAAKVESEYLGQKIVSSYQAKLSCQSVPQYHFE
jgi:hypothetical protein